jgi:hypothetical protein
MFQHSYRGTLVWLFIVGVVLGLTIATGDISDEIAAALLATYLALTLLVARHVPLGAVLDALPRRSDRQTEPSEVAREAMARARNHPSFDALINLVDVGLVVDEQRPDGLSLRRGRFISLDDDGVRPFAIIRVPEALGDRLGTIRFEIYDEDGQLHYVYETEKWLQTGDNALLPDYRFPIRKKQNDLKAGGWTVRVVVDDGLLGIHGFSLSPSLRDRRRLLSSDGEIRERVWRTEDEDESLPLSLEELLRQQSRQHRQS